MRYKEVKGHYPFLKAKQPKSGQIRSTSPDSGTNSEAAKEKSTSGVEKSSPLAQEKNVITPTGSN